MAKLTKDEQKQRTRDQIRLGKMLVEAGLGDIEDDVLRGALAALTDSLKDKSMVENYRARGRAMTNQT